MTGCTAAEPKDSIFQQADNSGNQIMHSRPNDMNGSDDMRDDPTNTNQSPDSFIDLSPDMPTRGTEEDKVRYVIEHETNYEPGPIMINGQDMWVRVYHNGMMSQEERVQEEAVVHKLLIKALPRYHIEVKMQEDRG